MKKYLLVALLLGALSVFGQTTYENYNWNTFPPSGTPDTIVSESGATVTLERRITEIYANKEGYFEEIFVSHKRMKLETHAAVDEYNKIYIPVNNVIDIIGINARFISPSGQIQELPQSSIKQLDNLDDNGDFKTFVIEGAEPGGILEYYYILRKKFNAYGTVYVQEDIPKSDVEVIFKYPVKLEYLFKTYNGLPGFILSKDTESKTQKLIAPYIPGVENEQFSFYQANRMRFEYTLIANNYNSNLRLYSYAKVSELIYLNSFTFSKSELKSVKSLNKKLNLESLTTEKKVREIENWVKSKISIIEGSESSGNLTDILSTKQTNEGGAVRLFIALLQSNEIKFDLIYTCKNSDKAFDPEFNGYNFLREELIYIPSINKYLVPDEIGFRIGVIPDDYQDCFGLFLHTVSGSEENKTLSYEVKSIPSEKTEQNFDTIYNKIFLDTDNNQLHINSHRVFIGNIATNLQAFLHLMNEEKKDELVRSIFNMGDQSITYKNLKFQHERPEDIGLNPMVIDIDITTDNLVETAGEDIIIKIGETIGKQSELYQKTARKLPIDQFPRHGYFRTLLFDIPAGYKIANPDDLNMNVIMNYKGKESCFFKSKASIEGNTLRIIVQEYYNDVSYPKELYPDFRSVINAAADFNKKTVVLTKL
jgi:hypothetical protein